MASDTRTPRLDVMWFLQLYISKINTMGQKNMLTLNIFVNKVFKHITMLAKSNNNKNIDELTNATLLPILLSIYSHKLTKYILLQRI